MREIRVQWIDAVYYHERSYTPGRTFPLMTMTWRGTVVDETDEYIAVAGENGSDGSFGVVFSIPKILIVSVEDI